jgi:hypothetical protein
VLGRKKEYRPATMKVKVKTVKQEAFDVELEAGMKV